MDYRGIKIENKQYKTKDIYLSAFLLAKAFHLDNLEPQAEGKFIFVFEVLDEAKDKLEKMVNSFYNRETVTNGVAVELLDYIVAQKQLKSRIYNYTN